MDGGPPDREVAADWPLWGGTARLVVRAPDEASAAAALDAARVEVDTVVEAVDAACSRFRPDSEVAALARAGGSPVPVSEVFGAAVAAALRAAELSDGAVDPTLGNALVAAGYDRDIGDLEDIGDLGDLADIEDIEDIGNIARSQSAADAAGDLTAPEAGAAPPQLRRSASWRDVTLDESARTVRVPDGVLLDLGATAKAFAADRAAALAHQVTGGPVLVSLCGDIAVVGTVPGRPWLVLVVERPDETVGPLVEIHDGGLATSTTRARRWVRSGHPMHHLLDPVTGLPAREVWRTVTVSAATCLDANIASTATVVKGDAGLSWLESTGLPARLVGADGSVRGIGDWPQGALEPAEASPHP